MGATYSGRWVESNEAVSFLTTAKKILGLDSPSPSICILALGAENPFPLFANSGIFISSNSNPFR